MSATAPQDRTDKLYKEFLKEARLTVYDIKEFLCIVLNCCMDVETERVPTVRPHLDRLIKSLCLIHALYGYSVTTNTDEGIK